MRIACADGGQAFFLRKHFSLKVRRFIFQAGPGIARFHAVQRKKKIVYAAAGVLKGMCQNRKAPAAPDFRHCFCAAGQSPRKKPRKIRLPFQKQPGDMPGLGRKFTAGNQQNTAKRFRNRRKAIMIANSQRTDSFFLRGRAKRRQGGTAVGRSVGVRMKIGF